MPKAADQIVGRAAELAELDGALARLERGEFVALELAGQPGIGKTRLLEELGGRADARGHVVLEGGAGELERDVPFWSFADALDDYVRALEPERLDGLDAGVRAELADVLPSLRTQETGVADRHDHRFHTHRAARRLLEVLAERKPLVLLLDDMHWADAGSIELLGSLLHRPPAARVLIALAVRPRQLPERLSAAIERAARGGGLVRLELAALTAEDATALLGDGVGAVTAATLYDESGGNPFYLKQLARQPRPGARSADAARVSLAGVELPRAVATALTDELALLPEATRRLLEGAAVAGDPFDADIAAAAAAQPEADALDALDELLARDLVRPTDVPRRFRFRHPLVRAAVYEAAPGGWRLAAHERSAELLAARGRPAVERAHHVERCARQGDMAAVALLREAAAAAERSAPATAARLYGAALRLLPASAPERSELLAALSGAHAAAGEFHEAYATTLECLELFPEDAVTERAGLTAACAGLEILLGRHAAAEARLVASLERLAETGSPEELMLLVHLAIAAFYRMEYAAMSEWAQRAHAVANRAGDPPLAACAKATLALAYACDGEISLAGALTDEAAALTDDLGDTELAPWLRYTAMFLAAAELGLDRLDAAATHAERALAIARATGREQDTPVLFWSGVIRVARGRLPEAVEVFEAGIEITRLGRQPSELLAWQLWGRSFAATAAGDVETALATAEESVELLRGLQPALPAARAGFALATALLPAGEPERAVAVLLDAAGGEELPRFPASWRAEAYELLVRCRLALGDRDGAARAAACARETADALGLPLASAPADRAAAAVALDAGDARGAAERALASAATAEGAGAVVDAALSRMLAGDALAAAGERDRAAAELERAAARFDECGALARRAAAERELRRLGRRGVHRRTRAGTADGTPLDSLTERELQIARLIVDRKTNREIATALFLGQKTIETHVRNLFRKLDVSSRVEVARVVERAERELRTP